MVLSLSLVKASQAEDHGPDGANEKSRNRGCLQLDGSSPQSISDHVPVPVGFLSRADLRVRSLAPQGHGPSALST